MHKAKNKDAYKTQNDINVNFVFFRFMCCRQAKQSWSGMLHDLVAGSVLFHTAVCWCSSVKAADAIPDKLIRTMAFFSHRVFVGGAEKAEGGAAWLYIKKVAIPTDS